ncbi:MAG TPA: ribosomal protein S18-alanine N-acetyltransferase [Deltaproteobacteria bacterium]|nr:ribosomal protein S18-alanine N-acetyltransferase [Deltaproteobacteria bacterium]HPR53517.1 ribosomal protein S18-alanine N-acetyltransferase [Deltaproteobacteria bacterium]HXK46146.1 ribosomal protein S18-alanine N-acetyltransferase [Deltaproteobacteria bacterium]
MDRIIVRTALPEDIADVVAIERRSFTSPWDEETFATTLEDGRSIAILAMDDDVVIGYCIALRLTSMVHVLNLAVHPDRRGKGIGRRLIQEILRETAAHGKLCAVLEVRRSNVQARSLYTSMGFSHVSTWHRYYSDTDEDAAIMVKDLRPQTAHDVTCAIAHNVEVADGTFHLVLEGEVPRGDPGQFVMVQVSQGSEPFLRRPLAILGQKSSEIELLYKIKGYGTRLLSRKRAGELVRVLGPLGKGFGRRAAGQIIYMAGGTGLPPLLALAEHVRQGVFILGAKTKGDLPLLERIQSIPNTRNVITTEDGSFGCKGLATYILRDLLSDMPEGDDIILYACGPEGMLREGARMAAQKGAYCELSLEERMSCGFGACAGCVVSTRKGTKRVCREGPVFAADDINWS